MSKTIMTISTEEQTKREFSKYAKEMWTNMTNLINMFMKNAPRSRKLEFYSPIEEVKPEKWEKESFKNYDEWVKEWKWEWIEIKDDKFFNKFK